MPEMTPTEAERLYEFAAAFDKTALGRITNIVSILAERGLDNILNPPIDAGEPDRLLTPSQACKVLGVSLGTLAKYGDRHGIWPIDRTQKGKAARYSMNELQEYITKHRGKGAK